MAALKTLEVNLIQSIKDFVSVYQIYEEHFGDKKLEEIKSGFVVPLLRKAEALMDAFETMENVVRELEARGIMTEEG